MKPDISNCIEQRYGLEMIALLILRDLESMVDCLLVRTKYQLTDSKKSVT